VAGWGRRILTRAVRAGWLRLSRTRWIGPITSFHLLDRFGAAANVPADLPALTKKAGCKAMLKAPSADGIKREVDATETIRAGRGALSPTPVRVDEIVRTTDAPHRRVLAALAELELSGEAVTDVGPPPSRRV
jgi:predicted Rossmann fold nucleotide-binding protein DprA/Smf involved in DNA uptake